MKQPERIDVGVYLYRGYTVQRSDQPGYEDRWSVYREWRPYRAWLKQPDGSLLTFGSMDEATAWLTERPDILPAP